jgi:hypothetical protein
MKVTKNKYLTDCVPFLLGFCMLVYVSSSLFFGCAAKTHQGKVSPDVVQGNQHLPDANSVDVEGLIISNQACSAIGNEVTFTVSMHNAPNPASALGFEVIYDENVLEYKSFAKGDLSQKFDMFDLSHTGTNTLRAGGVIAQGEIAKGQGGTLVELTFTIKQCVPASLKLDNLTDDLKGWPVHPGQLIVEKGDGSAKGAEDSESGSKEREKTSASENLEKQSENSKTNDPRKLDISSSETVTKNEGGSNSPDSPGMDNSKQNSEQANQANTSTLVFSPKKFSEDTSLSSRTEASKSAPASGNSISGHYTATLANTNPGTGQSDAKNVINLTNIGTDQSDPKTRKTPDPLPEQPTITPPSSNSNSSEQTPEQAQGGSLTIANQSCSGTGEDVTFSISAGNVSNKVAALGLEVKYDENILDYTGFTRGNLTQGFSMFDVVRQQPGTLRIGGIDIAATNIVQGATGTIASLTFKTKKCETTRVSLTNLHDDLKGWSSQSGQLQGSSAEQGAGLK